MTKITEKDGYTFKINIDNINKYGVYYNIKVKKKFLCFHIWVKIDQYNPNYSIRISCTTKNIVDRIQKEINEYIESRNKVSEITKYLESWVNK